MAASALDYLFSLGQFGIKFGLENIQALVAELGHPELAFRVVHVAGTNGKGSVTAMVDTALRSAGYRSARYTSPHLLDLTERFVIEGRPVGDDVFVAAADTVRDAADRLLARGALASHPTFFEATTATAFELFRRARVDIAVCEVGLGGRLDATNVVAPMVTAITSIALDHQQFLGSTLPEIAFEKAGIIKPAVPVVIGELDSASASVVADVARERRAPLIPAFDGVSAVTDGRSAEGCQTVRLRTPRRDYGRVELRLEGRHQIANAVVAVRALEAIDEGGMTVPPAAIVAGLRTVEWPGRLQKVVIDSSREALLDAAHNPAGAAALAAYLLEQPARPIVFAAMQDKDAVGMLEAIAPAASAFVMTRASSPRSASPSDLSATARTIAPNVPIVATETVRDALSAAWQLSPQIVVAGSIFLLGDVMRELRRL